MIVLKRLGLAMLLGIIAGGTGAVLTDGFSSSSVPSQLRHAYFGRTVFSTYIWGGIISSFSLVSSPIRLNSEPQAQVFSLSGMSMIISFRSRLGSSGFLPGFLRVWDFTSVSS